MAGIGLTFFDRDCRDLGICAPYTLSSLRSLAHWKFNETAFFVGLFFALNFYSASISASCPSKSFVGTWEYRQANSGNASGFDEEGERLELRVENGQMKGAYFGLGREGAHGLFYTAVEIKNIEVSNEKNSSGFLSLDVFYIRSGRKI